MFAVLLATTLGAAAVTAGPVATPGRPLLKISNQNNWHSTLMNVHAAGAEEHMHRSLSTSVLKDQPWHMLTGTFVSPCIPLDLEFDAYHVQKGSMIHTAEYGTNGQVQNDVTIYVQDYECKPNASETLAKFEYTSKVTYSGTSRAPSNRGGTLVEYEIQQGTYQFNFPKSIDNPSQQFFADLNDECSCGHNWTPNSKRTINPKQDCHERDHVKESNNTGDLCNFVVGNTQYLTLKWLDGNHVVSSLEEWDSREGWTAPFNMTYVWSYLPITGNTNPEICDYILWPKCQQGVTDAANICDTCTSQLECEQCVFRELPPDMGREYEWTECCPCVMFYANKYHVPWMTDIKC